MQQIQGSVIRKGVSENGARYSNCVESSAQILSAKRTFVQKRHRHSYAEDGAKEMRVLSSEKAALFIQYLLADLDACKFGIILSAMTGMRIGEICALKWENISLADGTVKVSSTMQRLRKLDKSQSNRTEVVIGAPKSNSSLRTIPLTKECLKLCEKWRSHVAALF